MFCSYRMICHMRTVIAATKHFERRGNRGSTEVRDALSLDDSGDLDGRNCAFRDHRGERSPAGTTPGAAASGGSTAIRAADFLCALDLHRDRAGAVCCALLRIRSAVGGSQRLGEIPQRIHGGILGTADYSAAL